MPTLLRRRCKPLENSLRDLCTENALLKAAAGKVSDVDAAWKLADKVGITLNDDGAITGMDDVIATTVERYPYLAPKPTEEVEPILAGKFPALVPSGMQTNKRKSGDNDTLNRAALGSEVPRPSPEQQVKVRQHIRRSGNAEGGADGQGVASPVATRQDRSTCAHMDIHRVIPRRLTCKFRLHLV